MRIWDLPVEDLCDRHLLGEHFVLHCIWDIIIGETDGGGYVNHPEVKRWVGRLGALMVLHEKMVIEMRKRGFRHKSELSAFDMACRSSMERPAPWQPIDEQFDLLRSEMCKCAFVARKDGCIDI